MPYASAVKRTGVGIAFALLCLCLNATSAEFHVSAEGCDTNPGTAQEPFASLTRAKTAVREALPDAQEEISVLVHAGVYRLRETLLLTEADSGRADVAVRWISADGPGRARISGSVPLKGWKRHAGRIWRVTIPDGLTFDTLYGDGKRLRKAPFPDYRHDPSCPDASGEYFRSAAGSPKQERGVTTSWIEYVQQEAPPADTDLAQLKICIFPWGVCDWHRWTSQVTALDRENRRISFDNTGDTTEILGGARYFLEDAMVFLDQPGEFFLDRQQGTLYCIPFGSAHPDRLNINAPVLKTLIEVRGESNIRPAQNLHFTGLRFEESDALSPSLFWWRHDWGRGDHALLKLSGTTGIVIRDCHFVNSGRHGILMVGHNTGNTVYGSLIEKIGISGITLSNRFNMPKDRRAADRLENNIICNNRVRHVGQLGLYASCIELMNTSGNEISFCELSHTPRYAVTLRGNTGTQHGPPITTAQPPSVSNRLHHLCMHHCGQDSGDMGALHAANLNNPGGGCTNTFEQITITDTAAIDSMMDIEPDGIFLDWPRMAMDQVFRDVQVVRAQGRQFRSNGPDNESSAITDNVSWKANFDESRMDYANVGLKPDFPAAFGGPPPQLSPPDAPRSLRSATVRHDAVGLIWKAPRNSPPESCTYAVYRDGQLIASTALPLFTDNTATGEKTFTYRVAARIGDFGPVGPHSEPCEVKVPADTEPPRLTAAFAASGLCHVTAFFDKPLLPAQTLNAESFSLQPDIRILSVQPDVCASAVVLETEPLPANRKFTLNAAVISPDSHSSGGSAIDFRTDHRLYHCTFDAPQQDERSFFARLTSLLSFRSNEDHRASVFAGGSLCGGASVKPLKDSGNNVLLLDGRDDYVAGPAALNLGEGDFTLAAWIWKKRSGSRVVLSKGDGFKSEGEWSWGWEYPPKARNIAFRTHNQYFHSASNSVPPSRWVHVAFVRKEGTARCYIGGSLSCEAQDMSSVGSLTNALPLMIGRRAYQKEPAWFSGMIDDLRIYTRALAPEEIEELSRINPQRRETE